jgi:hypothetical protein
VTEIERVDRMLRADVGTGVEPDPPLRGIIAASAYETMHRVDLAAAVAAGYVLGVGRPDLGDLVDVLSLLRSVDGVTVDAAAKTWTYAPPDADEPAE